MSEPLITPKPATTASPMSPADRLSPIARAVLRGAAKGLCCEQGGFQAAELWLLDEASRSLGLVAHWARKGSSQAEATPTGRRVLQHAPADVAALAGGAVVLEDPRDAVGWELHSPAAAAICLPVSSDKTIHGVLWLLADEARTIADETVELAEIVAGRLALEVERLTEDGSRLAAPSLETHATPPTVPAAEDEDPIESTPSVGRNPRSVVAAPVEAAAWSAPHAEGLAAAACWQLPEGRLLALTAAAIDSPESTAATQRAAVDWLMSEARNLAPRAGDAGLLLTLLNRRLLDSPLAGEGLAVAAALVDAPEDADAGLGGAGTWAFAGPTVALSIRAAHTESHAGDLVPLGWSEPESAYAPRPFELAVRQRLVLVAGDPRLTSPLVERRLGDVYRAASSDAHREMTPEGCLRRLTGGAGDDVLAAIALRRS